MILRLRVPLVAACAFLFIFLASISSLTAQSTSDYWPTDGWRTSSPEAQGMDSGRLADMLAYIEEHDISIHSVLIVRHGYLVTEAYRYPYQPDTLHSLQSCTKSVVSALVGIAIQQGYIDGADQHLIDLFPQRSIAHLDDVKRAVTLEHLLTMRSGLVLQEAIPGEAWLSDDFVQAILDLPLSGEPGVRFVYNGMATQLLAAVVAETSDMSAPDFATQNLFEPLGIQECMWETLGPGITNFGAGLWLLPRDMAKFGYLYARNGQWDGTQILPPNWIGASTTSHVTHPGLGSQPEADGYGYQWWVDDEGYFMALGAGGQAVLVQPDLDLVAVFTSGLDRSDSGMPVGLFDSFILPAAQSQTPLPENREKLAELETWVQALAQPESISMPPLPTTAERISNQVYLLEDNIFGWSSLALIFDQSAPEAIMIVNDDEWHIGMDGVVRINSDQLLLKGRWIRDDSLEIDWETLGSPYPTQLLLRFEETTVMVRVRYHGYQERTWRFAGAAGE